MLKQDFFAVPDGRLLYFDLLPLGAGGTLVCATAARIATHAHGMPPAMQPALTRAYPMRDGQVLSDEDPRDDGLLAERVAVERAVSLSFFKTSLVESDTPKPKTSSWRRFYTISRGLPRARVR